MNNLSEKIYHCNKCGRELKGEAAKGIEEEIHILLVGSDDTSLLSKAWFINAKNKRQGTAYCAYCLLMKKEVK